MTTKTKVPETAVKTASKAPKAKTQRKPSTTETPRSEKLTIEMPLDGFTPEKLDNLRKMIDSKAVLIKKALGAESLPIETTETTVKFAWFAADLDSDTIKTYSQFVAALCDTAKKKIRAGRSLRELLAYAS